MAGGAIVIDENLHICIDRSKGWTEEHKLEVEVTELFTDDHGDEYADVIKLDLSMEQALDLSHLIWSVIWAHNRAIIGPDGDIRWEPST